MNLINLFISRYAVKAWLFKSILIEANGNVSFISQRGKEGDRRHLPTINVVLRF